MCAAITAEVLTSLETGIDSIRGVLASYPEVIFGLLIGSRIYGSAGAESDWDVALWIPREISGLKRLSLLEMLRVAMAQSLDVQPGKVDVIDLPYAGLAMRAVVANEGVLLKQDEGTVYNRFLTRTWRELEEFQWELAHAA